MKTIKGFITFEGCEGVGKSSQLHMLGEYLIETNQKAVFTREPGGTPFAEKIRELILTEEMNAYAEANLFGAARSEHIDKIILPAINDGNLVVCDRYIDSSLAYQGYARGLGTELVEQINSYAINFCMPQATVFLNMDPNDSWRKRKGKIIENDRMEREDAMFHTKVYQGFLALSKKYADRYIEIIPQESKQGTNDDIIANLRNRGIIK
ncbi:MAG: dTMP kinase [Clostridia bacterium]